MRDAYAVLNTEWKKSLYDMFHQVDFDQEERTIEQIMKMNKIRNKKADLSEEEKDEIFKDVFNNQVNGRVMLSVFPFYTTWLILSLSFLKDDRNKAKLIMFLSCILCGYGEGYIA